MTGRRQLEGKHVLVTGGGRGIGMAIGRALLEEGARLTLAGRNTERLAAAVQMLQPLGEVSQVEMDVTRVDAVRKGFEAAAARFGPVSILVNNAGQALSAPFVKTDASLWQAMLDVNLSGAFHCTQAALPSMLDAGWGRIVNIASTAGLTGYAYVSAYCAAKHGLIGLTRALALEVATKGVTVNAVCPGFTDTDLVKDAVDNFAAKTGRSTEQARAELASRNPQKRLVEPEEVANAVVWLCLPGATAMNGQSLPVAGGEVM